MDRKQPRADAKADAGADPAGATLAVAIQHHQSGRLDRSGGISTGTTPAADPRSGRRCQPPARRWLPCQQGRNAVAVELISKAIRFNPRRPCIPLDI